MTEKYDEPDVLVIGPVAPVMGGVIYQINLASGAIVTNPLGFGVEEQPNTTVAIVTAAGQVLAVSRVCSDAEQPSDEFMRLWEASKRFLPEEDSLETSSGAM